MPKIHTKDIKNLLSEIKKEGKKEGKKDLSVKKTPILKESEKNLLDKIKKISESDYVEVAKSFFSRDKKTVDKALLCLYDAMGPIVTNEVREEAKDSIISSPLYPLFTYDHCRKQTQRTVKYDKKDELVKEKNERYVIALAGTIVCAEHVMKSSENKSEQNVAVYFKKTGEEIYKDAIKAYEKLSYKNKEINKELQVQKKSVAEKAINDMVEADPQIKIAADAVIKVLAIIAQEGVAQEGVGQEGVDQEAHERLLQDSSSLKADDLGNAGLGASSGQNNPEPGIASLTISSPNNNLSSDKFFFIGNRLPF